MIRPRTPVYRRLTGGIFRDVRSAVVALVLGGAVAVAGVLLADEHVEMSVVLVLVAIGEPALAVFLVLDVRLAKREGELSEARRRMDDAERRMREVESDASGPRQSPRSREVIGLIRALRMSIERRTEPYTALDELEIAPDEQKRFQNIVRAVDGIMPVVKRSTVEALDSLKGSAMADAATCLGALDELEARVTSYGEQDEYDGAASVGGNRVVIENE